jgi:release factor glutamine methyltransferase
MSQAANAEKAWTVGRLLQWTEQFFTERNVESPRLDAQILLAHALGCDRIHIYTRFDESVDDECRGRFRDLIRRRVDGAPVAYLVGYKHFYKLQFEVTPAVLIPRPATESLVVKALELVKPLSAPRVLDIGTGSGCIAISIAKQHGGATVTAIDNSSEALDVAGRNVARHGVGERVTLMASDVYAGLNGESAFDLIVSNPPYIASATIPTLAREVRDHEPREALDGGENGFGVFERVIAGAAERLMGSGWLLVEIGFNQESEARKRMTAVAGLDVGPTVRDADGHPRVVTAQRAAAQGPPSHG